MLKIDDTKQHEQLKELRDDGNTVWSISRLNNYNTCPLGYYLTYLAPDRDRGIQNIYSHAGSIIHDTLEQIHIDNTLNEQVELKKSLQNIYTDKLFDDNLNFPKSKDGSDTIENNWVNSMKHFANNFKKLPFHAETEKLFVYEIFPNTYIQGYIDIVTTGKNGKIQVLDWKTSSRFTGQKKIEAGRQLVLYKLAVEEVFGLEVDKVGWYMLKYARVHYGKRSKMVDRGKWVEQMASQIETQLLKVYSNELTARFALKEAVENNSIETLPQSVRDYFRVEPLIEYYEVGDKEIEELKTYIKKTIHRISNDFMFNPVYIDYKNVFFCSNLCSQRYKCPAYERYQKELEEKKEFDNK